MSGPSRPVKPAYANVYVKKVYIYNKSVYFDQAFLNAYFL